jgi:C4-dicarboxylate-specific signal transduction histidine kinase
MINTPHPDNMPKPQPALVPRNGWNGSDQQRSEPRRQVREARRAQATSADAQAQLAYASRVATLGEMSASIVHEVNQPLAAIAVNAAASLRWLTRANPDVREAIRVIEKILGNVERASAVIQRIRALARNSKPDMSKLDIDSVIDEVITLIKHEASSRRVSLRVDREPGLSPVHGDMIQLQQVIMNLVVNGIQAMASLRDRSRKLVIRTRRYDSHSVSVAVEDVGVGTDAEDLDQLFRALYTTKSNGMGMGLAISRSIIEAHGGRIWAARNSGPGMTFQFTVPVHQPND